MSTPYENFDDWFVIIPTSLNSFIYVDLGIGECIERIYDIKIEEGKNKYSINVNIIEYKFKNDDTYFIYEFNYAIHNIDLDKYNYAKNILWALYYGLEDNNKRKKELVDKVSGIIGRKVSMINFVGEDNVFNICFSFNYREKIIGDEIVKELKKYLPIPSLTNKNNSIDDDIISTLYTFDASSFYIVQEKYGKTIKNIYHIVFLEQDYESNKDNKYSNTIKVRFIKYKIIDNAHFIFEYIDTIDNPTLFTDTLERLIIEEKSKKIFDLHKKVLEITQGE